MFTDGDDNASLLNARAAVRRAKNAGVPVYAIAEGEALKSKMLLTELKDIAEMTRAQFYQAKKSKEIDPIFQEISSDLQHTYMLAYKAPPADDRRWRTIEVMRRDHCRGKRRPLPRTVLANDKLRFRIAG